MVRMIGGENVSVVWWYQLLLGQRAEGKRKRRTEKGETAWFTEPTTIIYSHGGQREGCLKCQCNLNIGAGCRGVSNLT